MRDRKKIEESKGSTARWLNTYADMVTLLLTFFVMLFAMSNIDAQKFQEIIRSFQGTLGINYGGTSVRSNEVISQSMDHFADIDEYYSESRIIAGINEEMQEIEDMGKIYTQVQAYIKDNNLIDSVEILNEKSGLLIRFKENVLFDSGKADLKEDAKEILKRISQILSQFNNDIRIEGHTDNVPMNTPEFPSNWELSTKRAVNVLKYFIEESGFDPVRLSAVGYGEYHPVADNDTVEGRRKNRRVDIVILRTYTLNETSPKKGVSGTNEQR
ncbi:MAG: OmpA family protein [Clostridiaceae bacterium]|nr:OmpA family protein [Clostridiaceae bacterium]